MHERYSGTSPPQIFAFLSSLANYSLTDHPERTQRVLVEAGGIPLLLRALDEYPLMEKASGIVSLLTLYDSTFL